MSDDWRPGHDYPMDFDVRRALMLRWLNDRDTKWSSKVVCPAPCGAVVALGFPKPGSDDGGLIVGLCGRTGRIEDYQEVAADEPVEIGGRCSKGHPVTFRSAALRESRRTVATRTIGT